MRNKILALSVLGLSLVAAPSAFAVFDLSILGGIDMGTEAGLATLPGVTIGNTTNLAGEVRLAVPLLPLFDAALGAEYAVRGYSQVGPLGTGSVTYPSIIVPLTLRLMPISLIGLSAGGYWSHGIGSVSSTNNLGVSTSQTYSQANTTQDDFGAVLGISFMLPLAPTIKLDFEGQYLYGFTNLDPTGASSPKARDIQVLAGINIGI